MMEATLIALPFLPDLDQSGSSAEQSASASASSASGRRLKSLPTQRQALQVVPSLSQARPKVAQPKVAQPKVAQPKVAQPTRATSQAATAQAATPSRSRPTPFPDEAWQSAVPATKTMDAHQRVTVIAGVAIAVTAGTLTQALNQAPVYEGSFQLSATPIQQTNAQSSSATATVQNNITPPSLISDSEIQILESPRILDPVVRQLQTQLPQLDYQTLVENLTITQQGDRTLQIHYRDVDPQRVKLVLAQLTQAFIDYGSECKTSTCKGKEHINEQVPQAQERIYRLRAEIQKLHQQHGITNLQAQLKLLDTRTLDLDKQSAQLQQQRAEAEQMYGQLQQRMALKPEEAIATQLLNQSTRYRTLLVQFQTLDNRFASGFGDVGLTGENQLQIQNLQVQHQALLQQLTQEAQLILRQYLSNPTSNLQNPIFQDQINLPLLQQSIVTTHTIEVMRVRQNTIGLAQQSIEQQRSQLIAVLSRYDQLKQKLDSETAILQQYFNKLDALQKQSPSTNLALTLTTAPELLSDNWGNPQAIVPDLQRNLGIGAIIGLLLGVGATAALDRRKDEETAIRASAQASATAPHPTRNGMAIDFANLPVDLLVSKAKNLADTRLREQFTQVA
ncbi:MAG: hypothetical protein MUF49_02275 [Oculatellaceae cyanobacterium Prado106]|nr:hypothetical protein [Oculatellaceae cyanobacterium Prado106]